MRSGTQSRGSGPEGVPMVGRGQWFRWMTRPEPGEEGATQQRAAVGCGEISYRRMTDQISTSRISGVRSLTVREGIPNIASGKLK